MAQTQINVRIDKGTKQQFQKRCIDYQASMQDVIETFVTELVLGHLTYDPQSSYPIKCISLMQVQDEATRDKSDEKAAASESTLPDRLSSVRRHETARDALV